MPLLELSRISWQGEQECTLDNLICNIQCIIQQQAIRCHCCCQFPPSRSSRGSGAASVPSPGTSSAAQSWPGGTSATWIRYMMRSLDKTGKGKPAGETMKEVLILKEEWTVRSVVFISLFLFVGKLRRKAFCWDLIRRQTFDPSLEYQKMVDNCPQPLQGS